MTKFYPTPPQKKPKSPQEVCPVPGILQPFVKHDEVAFVLHTGGELIAKVEGLDDDGDFIYGNLSASGACFALPITSVLYCVEVQ